MTDDKNSFASIIENAQATPELTFDELMSPFIGSRGEKTSESVEVPKAKTAAMPYKCRIQRFVINVEEDAAEYESIINQVLEGKLILRGEQQSITKDGDVIQVVSWLVPIDKAKEKAGTKDSEIASQIEKEFLATLDKNAGLVTIKPGI